eukprot:m.18409 g.18409  ORF g.18409 m.18409 type:complete len:231 (-) comp11455_c0_seq1:520-1212(-)
MDGTSIARARQILGVTSLASRKEITAAYKKAALRFHPDKNRGDEANAVAKFQEIKTAHECLLRTLGTQVEDRQENTHRRGRRYHGPAAPPRTTTHHRSHAQYSDPVTTTAFSSFRKPSDATSTSAPTTPQGGCTSRTRITATAATRCHGNNSGASEHAYSAPSYWASRMSPRWGAPCGGCSECQTDSRPSSATRKKRDLYAKFKSAIPASVQREQARAGKMKSTSSKRKR